MTTRGTSNKNVTGSAYDRRARRAWLVYTYRADVDVRMGDSDGAAVVIDTLSVSGTSTLLRKLHGWQMACRCYRCGALLTVDTVTVDRIIPGASGGTYRRDNIRPACGPCNSTIGGAVRGKAEPATSCELCHEPTRNRRRTRRGELLCTPCRDYFEWFDSLSPEDQRAEYEAVFSYEGTGV